MRRASALTVSLALLACACGGVAPPVAPRPAAAPASSASAAPSSSAREHEPLAPTRERPPAPAQVHVATLPRVERERLASGLGASHVRVRGLPVVHVRLVTPAGSASEPTAPALARLTAEMLVEGGSGRASGPEVRARLAALGASLSIDVGPDATTFALDAPAERLDDALDLLGAVVRAPRWDASVLPRVRAAEVARLEARARDDAAVAGELTLRELYRLPTAAHPYAATGATSAEVAKAPLAACQAFFRRRVTPRGSEIVVVGDVERDAAHRAIARALGAWSGPEASAPTFGEPTAPPRLRIVLADRPGSASALVQVALLAPARQDESWPALRAASEVLAVRLAEAAGDAPEAVRWRVELGARARGPVPLSASTRSAAGHAAEAVHAALEAIDQWSRVAISPAELEAGARRVAGQAARGIDGAGRLADRLAAARALGLGDDADEALAVAARDATPRHVADVVAETARSEHAIVVVVGDAATLSTPLSELGDVDVVDPAHDLQRVRTVPARRPSPTR